MNTYRITLQKIIWLLTVIFCFIYIYLWENRFIHSGIIYLLIGVFAVFGIIGSRIVPINLSAKIFLLIVVMNLLGLTYSKVDFFTSINWCISLAIAFFVYWELYISESNIKILLIIMCIASSVFIIGIYGQYFGFSFVEKINNLLLKRDSNASFAVLRSWGYYCGFSGYNVFSAIMIMIFMFIGISNFYITKNTRIKILSIIVVLLSFFAIIIVQKRGVFVACIVAMLIMLWHERLLNQSIIRQISFFLILSFFVIVIYYFFQSSSSGQLFINRFNNSDNLSSNRFDILNSLLKDWSSFFFLGNGPASTKLVVVANAHNIYAQVFYENGIVGLLLYLIFFFNNLVSAFKMLSLSKKRATNLYTIFIISSILFQIGFLIYGFFGNPINDLYIFLVYIIFSSIPSSRRTYEYYQLS